MIYMRWECFHLGRTPVVWVGWRVFSLHARIPRPLVLVVNELLTPWREGILHGEKAPARRKSLLHDEKGPAY